MEVSSSSFIKMDRRNIRNCDFNHGSCSSSEMGDWENIDIEGEPFFDAGLYEVVFQHFTLNENLPLRQKQQQQEFQHYSLNVSCTEQQQQQKAVETQNFMNYEFSFGGDFDEIEDDKECSLDDINVLELSESSISSDSGSCSQSSETDGETEDKSEDESEDKSEGELENESVDESEEESKDELGDESEAELGHDREDKSEGEHASSSSEHATTNSYKNSFEKINLPSISLPRAVTKSLPHESNYEPVTLPEYALRNETDKEVYKSENKTCSHSNLSTMITESEVQDIEDQVMVLPPPEYEMSNLCRKALTENKNSTKLKLSYLPNIVAEEKFEDENLGLFDHEIALLCETEKSHNNNYNPFLSYRKSNELDLFSHNAKNESIALPLLTDFEFEDPIHESRKEKISPSLSTNFGTSSLHESKMETMSLSLSKIDVSKSRRCLSGNKFLGLPHSKIDVLESPPNSLKGSKNTSQALPTNSNLLARCPLNMSEKEPSSFLHSTNVTPKIWPHRLENESYFPQIESVDKYSFLPCSGNMTNLSQKIEHESISLSFSTNTASNPTIQSEIQPFLSLLSENVHYLSHEEENSKTLPLSLSKNNELNSPSTHETNIQPFFVSDKSSTSPPHHSDKDSFSLPSDVNESKFLLKKLESLPPITSISSEITENVYMPLSLFSNNWLNSHHKSENEFMPLLKNSSSNPQHKSENGPMSLSLLTNMASSPPFKSENESTSFNISKNISSNLPCKSEDESKSLPLLTNMSLSPALTLSTDVANSLTKSDSESKSHSLPKTILTSLSNEALHLPLSTKIPSRPLHESQNKCISPPLSDIKSFPLLKLDSERISLPCSRLTTSSVPHEHENKIPSLTLIKKEDVLDSMENIFSLPASTNIDSNPSIGKKFLSFHLSENTISLGPKPSLISENNLLSPYCPGNILSPRPPCKPKNKLSISFPISTQVASKIPFFESTQKNAFFPVSTKTLTRSSPLASKNLLPVSILRENLAESSISLPKNKCLPALTKFAFNIHSPIKYSKKPSLYHSRSTKLVSINYCNLKKHFCSFPDSKKNISKGLPFDATNKLGSLHLSTKNGPSNPLWNSKKESVSFRISSKYVIKGSSLAQKPTNDFQFVQKNAAKFLPHFSGNILHTLRLSPKNTLKSILRGFKNKSVSIPHFLQNVPKKILHNSKNKTKTSLPKSSMKNRSQPIDQNVPENVNEMTEEQILFPFEYFKKQELKKFIEKQEMKRLARKQQQKSKPPKQTSRRCHVCPKCKKLFTSSEYKAHQKIHNQPKIAKENMKTCTTCKEQFMGEYRYMYHILKNPECKKQGFLCHICGKKFSDFYLLDSHVKHHNRKFFCDICGFQTIPVKAAMKAHISKHLKTFQQSDYKKEDDTLQMIQLRFLFSGRSMQHPKLLVRPLLQNFHAQPASKELNEQAVSRKKSSLEKMKTQKIILNPANKILSNGSEKQESHETIYVIAYKCNLCPLLFKHQASLPPHYKAIHNIKIHSCSEEDCSVFSLNKHEIEQHIKTCSFFRVFLCEFCGHRFADNRELFIHLKSKHPMKTKNLVLADTEAEFLYDNINFNSSDNNNKYFKNLKIIKRCDKCWEKIDETTLSHRCAVHVCSICKQSFKTVVLLKNHEKLHLNQNKSKVSFKLKCPECVLTFGNRKDLDEHCLSRHSKLTRSQVKNPERCQVCEFEVKGSNINFIAHMYTHKRNKNGHKFRCLVCKLVHSSVDDALSHSETHTENERVGRVRIIDIVTPFYCEFCDTYFPNQVKLKTHNGRFYNTECAAKRRATLRSKK